MGTLLLKGKKYQARVFVNGKLYTKSTKTSVKKDAEKILADFVADFQTKDEKKLYDNLAHRAMTFQQQIDKAEEEKPALTIGNTWTTYVAAQNRPDSGDRTMSVYQLQFGKFQDWMTVSHPEVLELRKVTQEIADEFATELGTTRSPNTFNKYITLFRTIWGTLRKTAKLTTNPWMPIRKKLLTTHTKRELTVEELYRVVTTATGELQVLFAIGIYTGLRLGDCAMLEWGSIDLVKSIITVSPRKTSRRNGQKSIRIPLHPALAHFTYNWAAAQTRKKKPRSAAKICKRNRNFNDRNVTEVACSCLNFRLVFQSAHPSSHITQRHIALVGDCGRIIDASLPPHRPFPHRTKRHIPLVGSGTKMRGWRALTPLSLCLVAVDGGNAKWYIATRNG